MFFFFLVCGLGLPSLGYMAGLTHKTLRPCLAVPILQEKNYFFLIKAVFGKHDLSLDYIFFSFEFFIHYQINLK
jgi:hypothetical protein